MQVPALLPIEVGVDGECTIDPLWAQGRVAASLHVVAGREVLSLAAQHHNSHFRILIRKAPGLIELLEHLWILGVCGLWTVDDDDGNAAVDRVTNELGFQKVLPKRLAAGAARGS